MTGDPSAREQDDATPVAASVPEDLGPVRSIATLARGLIFDRHLRRVTMLYVLVAAGLMPLAGEVFLAAWLRQVLLRFIIYWLGCACLTFLAVLLAAFDLLIIRLEHRRVRRELKARILGEETIHHRED